MASNKKFKILKGAVATTAVAAVVMPGGGVGATTVISDSQTEGIQESNTNDTVIKINSNKPDIPYCYYWTSGDTVYLSWDYGHVANRPTKIEAVIDSSADFSNPSYIQVKPKGAEFVPDISGDFYLRVRFFDSSGNVSHESIRKVIRNSSETREIKGLTQQVSGTGVKISWNNFTSGISSGQVFVNGQLYGNLSASDIKNNSVVVQNVSEGSEIKIRIINGNGLEYNGVVFVDKGSLQSVQKINLGLSQDGVGINVDLSQTGFKQGNRFLVKVVQKDDNDVIVSGTQITLNKDKGSFTIYPDTGKAFIDADYIVTITDLNTGDVYTYEYTHEIFALPNFVSVGLSTGEVVSTWDSIEGAASSELIWSTSPDFTNYSTIDVESGKYGVTFNTNLTTSQKVYLILKTYDQQGRIITQNVDVVMVGDTEGQLSNFKGVYKTDNVVEFSWNAINTDVAAGILKVNDKVVSLSSSELATLNSTNTLTVGGFTKGNKYDVSLYLLDSNGKVYKGNVTSIQTQGTSESTDVLIDGVTGIIGRYTINPGILTLLLDEGLYDVSPNSPIGILVNGQKISSVSAVYVPESNAINVTGLIPTKAYRNISLSYVSKSGESKTINIPNLTIKIGSSLDSFLVNAYNKAISRETQNIDEDGYNYWKNGLISKNITLGYFIRNLAYVPEFMNLINSPQDLITRLYQVLVLRDPEPQGLQFWTAVYNELVSNGVSHMEATMKILSDMTTSNEFSNLAQKIGVNP